LCQGCGGAGEIKEADVAYNAHFDTEKALLSMDNGVYFDENKAESTG